MNLESYIKKNRNQLDVEKPDEEYLWTGISEALKDNKKRNYVLLLSSVAAASAIIILSLTFTYFLYRGEKQKLIFVNIDPALARQEVQYKNQIETYTKLIKRTSWDSNQLSPSSSELKFIDDLISYYSKDLLQNGSNTQLINSLMDLYQKKIMLLERMLNEIEKSNDYEKHKIDI